MNLPLKSVMIIILRVTILILVLLHHFIDLTILPPLLTFFLVSIKALWIAHKRTHSEHFMFWFLSSLEARVNMTNQEMKKLRNKLEEGENLREATR